MSNISELVKEYYDDYISGEDIENWWDNTADYVLQSHFTGVDSEDVLDWKDMEGFPDENIVKSIKEFHSKYVDSKNLKKWRENPSQWNPSQG